MTEEHYVNTQELQEESLVRFMSSLCYEPLYDLETSALMRFKQPRFRCIGEEYIGLNRAIKLHNTAPESAWSYITTVNMDFTSFLDTDHGEDIINLIAAGNARIIKKVKGKGSRKGFFVEDKKGDQMVEFQSTKDYKQYRHWIGGE